MFLLGNRPPWFASCGATDHMIDRSIDRSDQLSSWYIDRFRCKTEIDWGQQSNRLMRNLIYIFHSLPNSTAYESTRQLNQNRFTSHSQSIVLTSEMKEETNRVCLLDRTVSIRINICSISLPDFQTMWCVMDLTIYLLYLNPSLCT